MKKRIDIQKLFRLAREESGSELVEFAMSALVLMTLVIGVIEFSLAMYTYHFLSSAAQQATRFAMVRGSTWSQYETETCGTSAPPNFTMPYDCEAQSSDIQNYVQSLATAGINPNNVVVNSTWPGTSPDTVTTPSCVPANSQTCLVQVTVSYKFNFLFLQNVPGLSMSATSEGVILQ